MVLIELILIIVFVFIALSLCILLIPFCFSFSFTKKEHDLRTEFEVGWFWGLIKRKFKVNGAEKVEKEKKKLEREKKIEKKKEIEKEKKKVEKEKKSIIYQFKDVYDATEYTPIFFELFYPFLKFIKDTLFSLKIKEIKLRMNVGFFEPHYTGFLAGGLYFIRGLTYAAPINPDIVIEPDFNVPYDADEMKLDISFKTIFEARVINFVFLLFRFILTKPARRLAWKFTVNKIIKRKK